MFICNFKVNKKKIVKFFILLASIIVLIMLAVIISKVFNEVQEIEDEDNNIISDTIPSPDVAELTPENYTDILKEVHEDLDTYIGQKISFTGYVYRVEDLEEDEFILARDMVINSKNQTVVVRFLMFCRKCFTI